MAGFCPNCGKGAGDDAIFCVHCGTNLAEAIAASLRGQTRGSTTRGATPGTAPAPGTIVSVGTAIPSKGGGCAKEMLILVLVFALLVVAGVGIAIHLARQIR